VRFSVVICCYNTRAAMERGIGSAIETTGPETELILVDNHPPFPDAREYLAQVVSEPRVRLIDPGENLGPFRGSHCGLTLAQGEYVVKLNDDLVVPPGWHLAMARALSEHSCLAYLALPWTPEQTAVSPDEQTLDGQGYRVKLDDVIWFGCVMLERRMWQQHFVYDQPGFYHGGEEVFYAQQARNLGKSRGYLVSHPGVHLARTPATDPLYGVWKVLSASGHPAACHEDFARWRERFQRPAERPSLLDGRAQEILLSFGYRPEDLSPLGT
jgi:GT2 family glycosyltransferase